MIKGKKYLKKQAVASVLALSMAAASLTGWCGQSQIRNDEMVCITDNNKGT